MGVFHCCFRSGQHAKASSQAREPTHPSSGAGLQLLQSADYRTIGDGFEASFDPREREHDKCRSSSTAEQEHGGTSSVALIDASTPFGTPYLQSRGRLSDCGKVRPELQILNSPFSSAAGFGQKTQQAAGSQFLDVENLVNLQRSPTSKAELAFDGSSAWPRTRTFDDLRASISNAYWIGQGASGAVVRGT